MQQIPFPPDLDVHENILNLNNYPWRLLLPLPNIKETVNAAYYIFSDNITSALLSIIEYTSATLHFTNYNFYAPTYCSLALLENEM